MLAVNGIIGAKKVIVETTSDAWPDFVFDKDYKLMPYNQLENYINKNKHLPHFPSAKEIETNGADLGELVKQQQQTIEELGLYIIQLNKRIEKLEIK